MEQGIACRKCGFQLELTGRRGRCPVCGTRVATAANKQRRRLPLRLTKGQLPAAGLVAALFLAVAVLDVPLFVVVIVAAVVLGVFGELRSRRSNAATKGDAGAPHPEEIELRNEYHMAIGAGGIEGMGGDGGGVGGGA